MQYERPPHTITETERRVLLVVTVTGHAIKHLFNAAFFVLLPEIRSSLSLSNIQIGSLSAIRSTAGGFANLPAGFAADRFSHKRSQLMGLSLALTGIFACTLGLTSGFWTATLAATLMVIAITSWHPAAISALSEQFTTRRGFAIGLHGTGGSVGEALGPLTAGLLIAFVSWRVVLVGSVVPSIIAGTFIWLLLRNITDRQHFSSSFGDYVKSVRNLLHNRRLLLVLFFAGGFAGGQSAVFTFLPIYLREDVGVSSIALGLYLSLAQVAGIGSQPIMGYLSDHLGRKMVLAPGLALLGIAFLGLYFAPSGWPFVLVVLIMGAFLFSLMAIMLAAAIDLVEAQLQATTVSLVFGSAVVMSGLSPAGAGFIADMLQVKATFLWASGIILLTSVLATATNWERHDLLPIDTGEQLP